MLDIGFTELLLVAAIGLVVLGPERLPHAIKVTAYWVAKIRRNFQSLKSELERETGVDEIRRQVHNEAVMKELKQTSECIQKEARDLKKTVDLPPLPPRNESTDLPEKPTLEKNEQEQKRPSD
ncbi:Sec-independent protein translocase protein TatB [Candidatus Sororendozoicomonas aggregata]|uniref:Sec-independent protein translocase protein TatB n=1 Tax=Candidatus Sororendozoicomonas aggregata TaxID=3073239 RepID=UPI002ED444EC